MEIKSDRVDSVDYFVFALICVFGAFVFLFYQRSGDFTGEDVFFADCARSLIRHGFYGLDGRPETTQPPGLSAILAVLFMIFGYGHVVCLKAMAVFEALGFLSAYALLRRHLPRPVAAAICLLLISSPAYFGWATQRVFPAYPLFFTTMTALLVFDKYESASSSPQTYFWGTVLASLLAASLMVASTAIALVGAIVAAGFMTFFKDRQLAMIRWRRLAPVLLMAVSVQVIWMLHKPAPLEWSLPGYPDSYWKQLEVKSGHDPELGLATLSDIPKRIASNADAQTDLMAQVVFRHGLDGSKAWVIIIPGLFAAAGWMYSIWKVRGIGPIEWYFAAYQGIYLLWPWTFELRFLIPIAPLICLYVWRGIRAIHLAALTNPRAFGFIGLPAGLVLGMSGIRYSGPGRFPDVLIAPLWIVLAACSLRMIQTGRLPASQIEGWLRSPIRSWNVSPWHVCKWATWTVVVVLLITGVIVQTTIAEANVMTPEQAFANDTSLNPMALELKSARWIKSNTPPAAVVMARHLPIVNHYAARRMVWFAPISNPDALMSGIITHRVDYIIVIRHRTPYYLPDDDSCFDPMLAKYSNAFQLVFHDRDVRIFHVERTLHLTLGEKSHYDVES